MLKYSKSWDRMPDPLHRVPSLARWRPLLCPPRQGRSSPYLVPQSQPVTIVMVDHISGVPRLLRFLDVGRRVAFSHYLD
jgi:hypothetical protein